MLKGQALAVHLQVPVPLVKIERLGLDLTGDFWGLDDGMFWDSGPKAVREWMNW
jgi:hypothetical protein